MRIFSGLVSLAALGVAAVLLAGCTAPSSVADRVERGFPDSLTEAERAGIVLEEPSVLWLEDGSRFALITWGSSSCPRVVTALEAVGDDAIELRLEPSGGSVCTADMAATTHELTLPATVTGRPIAVTLTYSDWDEPTELTLD